MSISDFKPVFSAQKHSASRFAAISYFSGLFLFYLLRFRSPELAEGLSALCSEYSALLLTVILFAFLCAAFSASGFIALPITVSATGFSLSAIAYTTVPELHLTPGSAALLILLSFSCTFSTLFFSAYAFDFSKCIFTDIASNAAKRKRAVICLCCFILLTVTVLSVCLLKAGIPIQ